MLPMIPLLDRSSSVAPTFKMEEIAWPPGHWPAAIAVASGYSFDYLTKSERSIKKYEIISVDCIPKSLRLISGPSPPQPLNYTADSLPFNNLPFASPKASCKMPRTPPITPNT